MPIAIKLLPLSAAVLTAASLLAASARAQKVVNPNASFLDASARRAFLKTTTDPLLREVLAHLPSCVNTPLVAPPANPVEIPHHYLHASNGPTNPAETAATRVFRAFEHRITAGMNQYVATGSQAEAACALTQLDAWAKANALTGYDAKAWRQSWYQADWTLGAAGVTDSVLRQDSALDSAQQARVAAWLRAGAHELISNEKPGALGNNHHYWRALATTSIGVLSNDDELVRFGIYTYRQAIGQLDSNSAFPLEMARHENAIHYQAFALQPLVMIAEFAARQNIDLYSVSENGRTLRDAIVFLGRAMADPTLVHQYTTDPQRIDFSPADVAALNFYVARFGSVGVPPSITGLLRQPAIATRIGGNTTLLAAK